MAVSGQAIMPQTYPQTKQNHMSITKESELIGMKKASEAVAKTLKEMRNYAQPGMTTRQLDRYGAKILSDFGAKSAPYLTYGFPGWTCISVNNEFCHGI
ncbi:MAG: M24 family metallopeptidase, partial [Saprospiraceae bacterium]|nr:M24 family metallopeptidase [Saprospiraceae bacterium]